MDNRASARHVQKFTRRNVVVHGVAAPSMCCCGRTEQESASRVLLLRCVRQSINRPLQPYNRWPEKVVLFQHTISVEPFKIK